MYSLLTILILLVVQAVSLYWIVRLMNPNPEVNPTLLECVGYSFIGMALAIFPGFYALAVWLGWWGYVFSKIFFLNDIALVIGLVAMRAGVEITVRLITYLAK